MKLIQIVLVHIYGMIKYCDQGENLINSHNMQRHETATDSYEQGRTDL